MGLRRCETHGAEGAFLDIRAVMRSLTPSAKRAAPKIMMTSWAAWKGLTTSRIPRITGMRDERSKGNEDSGLDLNGGNDQRNLPHTVHQEKGAQHQREEGENRLGPQEGEGGEGDGENGQEEASSGGLSVFTPLNIPPQVADRVGRSTGGQRPYKDRAADSGEEEQRDAQKHIEQCDPDRSGPGPEELQCHNSYLLIGNAGRKSGCSSNVRNGGAQEYRLAGTIDKLENFRYGYSKR